MAGSRRVAPSEARTARGSGLNLARKPFVNARPVRRLALILWVLGGLLLVGNVWLYWDFLAGRGDAYARLEQVETEIAAEREAMGALDGELAAYDLAAHNAEVGYLNQRIDQRRFPWSRLFDDLTETLPADVRLESLSPAVAGEERQGVRTTGRGLDELPEGAVLLQIDGATKDSDELLEFVDALFGHPAFSRPTLNQETRDEDGLVRFNLRVVYAAMVPGRFADDALGIDAATRAALTEAGITETPMVVLDEALRQSGVPVAVRVARPRGGDAPVLLELEATAPAGSRADDLVSDVDRALAAAAGELGSARLERPELVERERREDGTEVVRWSVAVTPDDDLPATASPDRVPLAVPGTAAPEGIGADRPAEARPSARSPSARPSSQRPSSPFTVRPSPGGSDRPGGFGAPTPRIPAASSPPDRP